MSDFKESINKKISRLESILERLDLIPSVEDNKPRGTLKSNNFQNSKDIFIVHGHDEAARESATRFLEKLDLNPIILHEKPNQGQTIIEKFETNSNVGFAVILLTPDDLGASKVSPMETKPRARQNVILELGYFLGKLCR